MSPGALSRAGNLLLGLRGAPVQLLSAGGLLLRQGGMLRGFPAQSFGFGPQFLSPSYVGVSLSTMTRGL